MTSPPRRNGGGAQAPPTDLAPGVCPLRAVAADLPGLGAAHQASGRWRRPPGSATRRGRTHGRGLCAHLRRGPRPVPLRSASAVSARVGVGGPECPLYAPRAAAPGALSRAGVRPGVDEGGQEHDAPHVPDACRTTPLGSHGPPAITRRLDASDPYIREDTESWHHDRLKGKSWRGTAAIVPPSSTLTMDRRSPVAQITLTDEEAAILREALRSYVSDLRMEIANTDSMQFRENLKREEAVLKKLLQQLDSELAASGASS
jgi:hypothetical protein